MAAFNDLVAELQRQQRQRRAPAPTPRRVQPPSRPTELPIFPRRPDTRLAKALTDAQSLLAENNQLAKALGLTSGIQASQARVEDARRQARALIAEKSDQMMKALAEGQVTALQSIKYHILLDEFAQRMGL